MHGFATFDDYFHIYNVLFWNFSDQPVHISLTLDGVPAGLKAEHVQLDANASSGDENIRLRPFAALPVTAGHAIPVDLPAYGVIFWSVDAH